MKRSFIILLVVLFFTSVSTFAQQLTKADIQSLETKITKIQETVTDMNKRLATLEVKVIDMDKRLTALEVKVTEMDKRVTTEVQSLQIIVTEMDKRLTTKITGMDERLSKSITETDKRLSNQIAALYRFVRWAISVLVLVILAVIALPQIFGYLRDKNEREELQKQVVQLEQEVAQLKTQIPAS